MFNLLKNKTSNWDRVAKEYDELVGDSGDFNHKTYINPVVLGILGNVKNYNVLDLACGQGYFSKILHSKGAHVVGVDISEKLIEIAEKKFGQVGIKFLVRDAANMEGVASNQFDFVVCNMSFHDIEHVSETIDEISRVLQIGGKLVFSIPHPWTHVGETIKEGDGYYLKLKKYRSEFEFENHLYGEKGIVSYHRPLEYYVKKLADHRFEITNFVEISTEHAKGELVQDKDYLNYKKEFPSFLVVGATKNLVVY
ncbi:class I SAM-dependent methyltransferase [Patescibacteria group bacterium]|nr:class I SAM-dependent methyltransferase [Patescibacteria group bacterium]